MKSNIVFTVCAAILLAACAGTPKQTGYTVTGEIPGVSGKAYLSVFEGKMPRRIDSTEISNGTFTFSGRVDMPIFASVETVNGVFARFFLENSPIALIPSATSPDGVQVTGSGTHDLFVNFNNSLDSLEKALTANTELSEEDRDSQLQAYAHAFVKNHPQSVAAAYVLYRQLSYSMSYEELYSAVGGFDPAIRNSIYLQMVTTMADALKNTSVGQSFTDIAAPDTAGVELALSSLVGPGKYILVDFWASWCPPCRAESPNMVAAYKQYAPKGFEIYAVSLDRDRAAWLKGISELGLTWKHVSTLTFWESAAADAYGVRAIPANVLVGPDGTILARNLMGEDLQKKLAEVMK